MRRKILRLTLILSIAFGAVAHGQQQQLQQQRRASESAPKVERLRAHITYLASDKLEGRRTGTPGADLAAAYIAKEFASYGLIPGVASQSERHKNTSAIDLSYMQRFPFVAGVELGKGNQMSFTPGAAAGGVSATADASALAQVKSAASLDLRPGEDWMPLGFSPSVQLFNGPVTFVGYGITASDLKYDDYAGALAGERIAIAFAGTPDGDNPHGEFARYADVRWKAIAARDHGAKALVVIAGEENFKDDRLSRLSYDNSSGEAGLPVVAVSRQAAAQLLGLGGIAQLTRMEEELRRMSANRLLSLKANATTDNTRAMAGATSKYPQPPGGTISLTTDILRRDAPAANVIAILEGSDPALKSEAIIIGAHYDHLGRGGAGSLAPREGEIHYGADDNASGTAGLLELARLFSAKRSQLKRTLIFIAFSGEEEGLLGSSFYVNHPVWPLAQTAAMINMDMIGRMRENSLIVGGMGTASEWGAWINSARDRMGMVLDANGTPKKRGAVASSMPVIDEGNSIDKGNGAVAEIDPRGLFKLTLNQDGYGPSDHSSFYAKQVPVLFFWTGTHEDYHKPSDTADKINYEDEARILSFVATVVRLIDESERRPTYTVAKSESSGRSMGFRVYLGTIPNYAETSDGLKLDGVREDSPAARAGLKAGDRIVKLAGREVRNVYDYTYALGEMKAGQEYEVEVVRATEHLKLKITPAARR